MAIKERIEQPDLQLYEILKNPVLNSEFINNFDIDEKYDSEFSLTDLQREIVSDFNSYVSVCTARAVGKTVSLVSIILWIMTYGVFPGDYILYTVPSKVHLQPVWEGLMRGLRNNSFLKQFIKKGSGINSSDFQIKLLNGQTLICRIAGQSGTGANVIGLHTPFILADECGYYPWNVFQEMQPSVNSFTQGFREMTAGVPTGMREKNVLYHTDQENSSYSKHRATAYDNPRVSEADIEHAIEQYGGTDTEDFIHYIMGEHGKPVFALFDRSLFLIKPYPVVRMEIDGLKFSDNFGELATKIDSFPPLTEKNYGVFMGIDLGYTEPTAIIIFYKDGNDRMRFHGRIKLSKVSYPIQEKIIDLLDTKFNPSLIGVDKGNVGISVVQTLTEHLDYAHKNYKKRVIPIDFSSSLVLGIDSDGNEIKTKTKAFTVSVLQEFSNNHKIVYSSTDLDLVTELERMTYSRSPNGDIVYRTMTERGGTRGEDHFTAALLCGIGAYHLENDFSIRKPVVRLLKTRWVR